ncbi:3-deoxy-D-manno-octulosonic acid transferase [Salegentibacter maritimus]|uniref:3-deoxy-D-manno-octulosonic acid transferase n=1 Tax=Salegentibacter maritimus TaxID=2794347 RepID=UPI0018E4D294|nr:glycosyltransferase N-terminal domain-containing protein [Salegentibacter maritimus]MBI6117909.1 3-deoxy-D-manno-octulosonic acid transferase [Salegentibacter maritimus]
MRALYNLTTSIAKRVLPLATNFNEKLKLFTEGRKSVFTELESKINPKDDYLWFHAASLGEFEQALPIIEEVKKDFPHFRILITFFSPSGYENKKNHPLADIITYLPLDTRNNAKRFLALVQPKMAFFIKYEIWPNFLSELKRRGVRTLLVSGAFRKNQIYFKSYGSFMRKALSNFDHFFVQNKSSMDLLQSIGFNNITLSGDTRFDRVSRQIKHNNKLDFAEEFINNTPCLVAGSTWPEDDELIIPFINTTSEKLKVIIAPHEIKEEKLKALEKRITKKYIRYSKREHKDLKSYDILILDTIGLLGKVYSYADIAYVGGAAGTTGLHNILEPATFGTPVVIGKNYKNFPEAIKLRQLAGLFVAASSNEFSNISNKLITDRSFREKTGMIAGHFINSNTGATHSVMKYLKNLPDFAKVS